MPSVPEPCGVVCHDAGGANQIRAMWPELFTVQAFGYFEGPANQIFYDGEFGIKKVGKLDTLVQSVSSLISGTGWASCLEHRARLEAKKRGIKSIAVLDHWTNYEDRFVRNGEMVLPDEIWVVDEFALKIAKEIFPGLAIKITCDYYLQKQVCSIKALGKEINPYFLYLLEPIHSNWNQGIPGEFQALDYTLGRLRGIGVPPGTKVRIRPHPSDPHGKYGRYLGNINGFKIELDSGDLDKSIAGAAWVAGCNTYALVLALEAGKEVYCSIPPWGPKCVLPHSGLKLLQ